MSTSIRSIIDEIMCHCTDSSTKSAKSKKPSSIPPEVLASSFIKLETIMAEFNEKIDSLAQANFSLTEKVMTIETETSDKIKRIKNSFLSLKEKTSQLEEKIKVLEEEKTRLQEIETQLIQRKKVIRSVFKELQMENAGLKERVIQLESLVLPACTVTKSLPTLPEDSTDDFLDDDFILVKEHQVDKK